jgi:hypothetical protein
MQIELLEKLLQQDTKLLEKLLQNIDKLETYLKHEEEIDLVLSNREKLNVLLTVLRTETPAKHAKVEKPVKPAKVAKPVKVAKPEKKSDAKFWGPEGHPKSAADCIANLNNPNYDKPNKRSACEIRLRPGPKGEYADQAEAIAWCAANPYVKKPVVKRVKKVKAEAPSTEPVVETTPTEVEQAPTETSEPTPEPPKRKPGNPDCKGPWGNAGPPQDVNDALIRIKQHGNAPKTNTMLENKILAFLRCGQVATDEAKDGYKTHFAKLAAKVLREEKKKAKLAQA